MADKKKSVKVQVCCLCSKPLRAGCGHSWNLSFDKWSKTALNDLVKRIGPTQHPGS